MKSHRIKLLIQCIAALAVLHAVFLLSGRRAYTPGTDRGRMPPSLQNRDHILFDRDLGPVASIHLKMKKPEQVVDDKAQERIDGKSTVSQGPHEVFLKLNSASECKYPRFAVRLVGDALVHVNLKEETQARWKGTFTLPRAGSYSVDARWYACDPGIVTPTWTPLSESVDITSVDTGVVSVETHPLGLFPNSAWVSTKDEKNEKLPEYIWKSPVKEKLSEVVQLPETTVVVGGTTRPADNFFKFGDMGNYELLCFVGSQTMSDIRSKFLEVRPKLFPKHRPFKFHYYNVTDMVHPATDWTLESKQKIRKCKHILFSIDEPSQPTTQVEYKKQITTFVGHLLKVIDDDTFPIWLITSTEPPMHAKNCYDPLGQRTSDHPCNHVLRELFLSKAFPERVHLLDNTDVTLPRFDEAREDVLSIIALRVAVVVGKGVSGWREMGQKGMIDGLHRNGEVEPNFKLMPYTGWE